ncbi:MAG: hydantoinase/oxoprolinase family protein [Dehalococcoidia bacterium]
MKRVGVDVGGTFTDLVWVDESSAAIGHGKTLSTADPSDALTAVLDDNSIAAKDISLFLHATTVITNLILERNGARVGFVTTRGFRDVLEIQTALRPNPYDLHWERTLPLVPRHLRVEIDERVDATGTVLQEPSEAAIEAALETLVDARVEALAVCLLNSHMNPVHERTIAAVAQRRWPSLYLSISSELDPRIREYPRMSTTVANAYVMPKFDRYTTALERKLSIPSGVKFMQSSGGVASSSLAAKAPVNLIYSGPVGGVLATQHLGRVLGIRNMISVDMGGTSFDVCIIRDGEPGEKDELFVEWGIPVRTHTLDIYAIGAGGGSVASIDAGGALTVGPTSAGADPGPASYDRGGERATVTDANLLLGLIRAETFAGGTIPLNRVRAEHALGDLADRSGTAVKDLALGIHRIVTANMAQAIREITVFKGIDPRDYHLVAFGGCGPQHAVGIAAEIGMKRVIVPVLPSVFSAFGLLTADLRHTATRTVITSLRDVGEGQELGTIFRDLEETAMTPLATEPSVQDVSLRRIAYIRYIGQSHELAVALDSSCHSRAIYHLFEEEHFRHFGTRLGDPAEIVDVMVVAQGRLRDVELHRELRPGAKSTKAIDGRTGRTPSGSAKVIPRAGLGANNEFSGPVLIEEPDTTSYIPPGAVGRVDAYGNLHIHL